MIPEEILCEILNQCPVNDLCSLRRCSFQFNRIAREILQKRVISISGITKSPFDGSSVFREPLDFFHEQIAFFPTLHVFVALFSIGEERTFACLHFSNEISFPTNETVSMLCLMPFLHVVSFEPLAWERTTGRINPQYIRIEKIHHIQAYLENSITVRTELREFSNIRAKVKVELFEITEALHSKKRLAPFIEEISPIHKEEQFNRFITTLKTHTCTSCYHADATRVKFEEQFDSDLLRHFSETIHFL